MFSTQIKFTEPNPSSWETHAANCQRDLILKKIAICVITAANFVALGYALYYIISYCPVPAQALVASPFIMGVIGALTYLRFPTYGISTLNYSGYVNPVQMVGKILVYFFFSPVVVALNYLDWTPYHDPYRANKISDDLNNKTLDMITTMYGKNVTNLEKYGFIPKQHAKEFFGLIQESQVTKNALDFWQSEELSNYSPAREAERRKYTLERKWNALRTKISSSFPHPLLPPLDFSKTSTSIYLKFRDFFCLSAPINLGRE